MFYKRSTNHIIGSLLWLSSFCLHDVLKIQPCCRSIKISFVFLLKYSMEWVYHILLIHLHVIEHLRFSSPVTSNGVLWTLMFMNARAYNHPETFWNCFQQEHFTSPLESGLAPFSVCILHHTLFCLWYQSHPYEDGVLLYHVIYCCFYLIPLIISVDNVLLSHYHPKKGHSSTPLAFI